MPIHTRTPPAVASEGGGYVCKVQVNVDIAQELLPDRGKPGEVLQRDDVRSLNMTLASAHLIVIPHPLASL